jgi:hypothetical protein
MVAAIAITDASNPSAIFFIETSHAASFLRGVLIVNAIMPQPTRSGKPQPKLRRQALRLFPQSGMKHW